MDAKSYLKVSAVNLSFLVVGLLVSPIVVRSIDILRVVHAQNDKTAKVESAPKPAPANDCDPAHFECVVPQITSGAAGFGIILAGRIATDKLTVNGFDSLKIHESTLSALERKGLLTSAEVQKIISDSKVEKPLRLQLQK